MDFFAITRGSEPVSEEGGLHVFELLAPVLLAAPDDDEAVEVAAGTISRMPREALGSVLLDWWFVTTTGGSSPLGLAFHLPDSLPIPLRIAMESVTSLAHTGLRVPVGRWVREAHAFEELLGGLDEALQLDSYGKVALPKERDVWAQLQELLTPTVNALRSAERSAKVEFDQRGYEKKMKAAGIAEGSRRWNEMLKRANQCVSFVNRVVAAQAVVEPWVPRDRPAALDALPAEVTALGPVVATLLGAVAPTSGDHTEDRDDHAVALLLSEACCGRTLPELSWLAAICDQWIAVTGETVDGLEEVLTRRARISQQIERLREEGFEVDEAEIHLLEHDLPSAEAFLDEVDARRKLDRWASALKASLDHLWATAQTGPAPEGWPERFDLAKEALSNGELEVAELARVELDRDLRAARRSGTIDELRSIGRDLTLFRAATSLIAELDDHLRELDEQPDLPPDEGLITRSRERLDSLRHQRAQEVDRKLVTARGLLDGERDLISPDALLNLESSLDRAEEHASADNTIAALDILDELLDNIDAQRVHRWTASEGEEGLVRHIVAYCTQEVHFDPEDVRRLYVAAKTKPFVILAGLTGSGKSTIARLFAGALGADARNGRFRRVAVRPDWIDQSEVLGTVNPLSNRFEPGWLASTARQCERNPDQIHVVLLDEMNLAPVEQYLAEYLSALEEARSGSEGARLPLYSPGMTPENADDWPASLAFPLNLILIGTVNVDETTRALSDRVLDRANVLQLSVTVSDAHHRPRARSVQPWHVPFPEWESICELDPDGNHHDFLVDIADLLQGVGIGVGQRAHVELERFVANARGVLPAERSLDLGVLQRIIPKIRGFKRDLVDGLAELQEAFGNAGCQESASVVESWLDDRVSDDEFLDGTDARVGLLR